MFLLLLIDQEGEEMVELVSEKCETDGLNTGLNNLKYPIAVCRYVPTEHTGETVRKSLSSFFDDDKLV